MTEEYDLLIAPIGTLITLETNEPRKGYSLRELPIIINGAVGIKDGKIAFVGKYKDLDKNKAKETIDASDCMVMPGFVDCHTHIPFVGERVNEMVMRFEGKSYMEIAKSGGGILSTMKQVRVAPYEALLQNGRKAKERILKSGVTSFEGKSGYGLDFDNEIKQLKVLRNIDDSQKIVSTCLSAHFLPPEFQGKREKYVELITEKILPFVKENNLADFVDVFCENGAFNVEESKEILLKGKDLGFKLRIHADEIENSGGGKLASEIGCRCADHLLKADDETIDNLSSKNVVAVLLPATAFFLRKPYAPARKFIEKDCIIAIASDLNPGSSYTYSMLSVLTIAVFGMGLFPEEAIWAATYNAAYALAVEDEVGSIEVGKRGDITILSISDPLKIFYPFGEDPIKFVIVNGKVVYRKC